MKWGRAWVLQTLRNRLYTGQVAASPVRPKRGRTSKQLHAEWIDSHPAIIPMDLFTAAQAAISKRRTPGRKPAENSGTMGHLVRGLARCVYCGAIVAAVPASKRARQLTGYYVCNRRLKPEHGTQKCEQATYHRRDDVDSFIAAEFSKRCVVLRRALALAPRRRERPDFDAQRKGLERERENLVEAVAKGGWKVEWIQSKMSEIADGLARIKAAEDEFQDSSAHDTVEARTAAKAYVQQIDAEFSSWNVPMRREFVKAFAAKIVIGIGEPIITWRDPGDIASDHQSERMPAIYRMADDAMPGLAKASIPALPAPNRISVKDLIPEAAPAIATRRR